MPTRREILRYATAGMAASTFGVPAVAAAERPAGPLPNILMITADDLSAAALGCFGGLPDISPNIDSLAAQGLRYTRAHVAVAVCQPSRSAVLTGLWPHRNGAMGFEDIKPGIPLLTDVLRPAGYQVGIMSKETHLAPRERFGWDFVREYGPELGYGRDPQRYRDNTARFIAQAGEQGRPWFLMANSNDPHRPHHGSPAEQSRPPEELATFAKPSRVFAPGEVPVPGFLPDLPVVRQELAEYASSIRRCDDTVGAILAALDASGQAANTIVIFFSDNGMPFPFAKSNCYPHSTRTPLIIRWPGHVAAGRTTDTFASTLDLFPTICEVLDTPPPEPVSGGSMLGLLTGHTDRHRDRVHTVFHEPINELSLEMRCTQDARFAYLWNDWSDGVTVFAGGGTISRTWPAMRQAAQTDPAIAARVKLHRFRVREELYRIDTDPDCLTNLATDPTHAPILHRLRHRMHTWMRRHHDPLLERYLATEGSGAT